MLEEAFKYDITYVALQYFEERSFEIVFDVFNKLINSEDLLVNDFLLSVGDEELYKSLHYHNDMIKSVFSTKKYQLLDDFFIWKYSVYNNRGVDLDYFLLELSFWKNSINNFLYLAHSNEINIIYDYLTEKHEVYKKECLNIKYSNVEEQYQEIFENLKNCLFKGDNNNFYSIIEKNLFRFNNDIFLFIENIINPLMYDVGFLWQYNQISIAKEHLATNLTQEIIDKYFITHNNDTVNNPLALISTIGEENHNLGVKIVGQFLKSKHFNVKNLGSKISNKELISSIYELKPEILVLSVTLISNLEKLYKIIKELKSDKNLFDGLIIVGGQALFRDNDAITIEGVDLISKDLKDLETFLKNKNFN